MPYHKNFNELWSVNEIKVFPNKWNPLVVEYGYGYIGTQIYVFWRIKNTKHTFKISLVQLNELSKLDYEKHISDFLEIFREDYLSWVAQGLPEEWMREYHKEYREFINI